MTDHDLHDCMDVFDRLPPSIREVLNYSWSPIPSKDIYRVEALICCYGEQAVLQALRDQVNNKVPTA
jgi:hypothetical protein